MKSPECNPLRAVKGMRGVFATALLMAACNGPMQSPGQGGEGSVPTPGATEPFVEPSHSPETILKIEQATQLAVDAAFPGLGIHETRLAFSGLLQDTSGQEYGVFTSQLPDRTGGEDIPLLLLGELDNNAVESIKGLAVDEAKLEEPYVAQFLGFSNEKVEGPLLRTTNSGEIEVFRNGVWEQLDGISQATPQYTQLLGGSAMAAPVSLIRELISTPTPLPTPEATPAPEPRSCLDQEAQQRVVNGFLDAHDLDEQSLGDWIENKIGISDLDALTMSMNGRSETTPFQVNIDKAIVLGRFRINIDNGHGNCIVVAYKPEDDDNTGGVRIFSALMSVTIDSVWSGMINGIASDAYGKYDVLQESSMLNWIDDMRGAPIQLSYIFRVSETDLQKSKFFQDNPISYVHRHGSLYAPIARNGYVLRYGNDDGLYEEEYKSLFGPGKDVQYDPVSVSRVLSNQDIGLLLFLVESIK